MRASTPRHPHQRAQGPDLDLVLAGAPPAPVPALLEALALPRVYSARALAVPRFPPTRVAPAEPDRSVTYGNVSSRMVTLGESAPPTQGLGLLLPHTPAELQHEVEIYGPLEIELEFHRVATQRWSGVTLEEVRRTLRSRYHGTWRYWGPFMSDGSPWPWSEI